MTYKLPEHLEPYRGYIEHGLTGLTVEQIVHAPMRGGKSTVRIRIDLLQRLYDAGKLVKPLPYLPDDDYSNDPESII